ncbi:MAG: 3-oxoacyl-[acyl-carrier-protein] reductase [Ignavibacteriaceae bacterium]|nr:3-oxoacyl-[acyl-carrier-protein] reductase [Ignavibacteriaceae bacterium]NUM70059.1 3-oxoacyl-[acyl-carrier-protein] reductase [Ignavibacteriaceae bacterium]
MIDLKDKRALVTGGTRGIGKGIVLRLAEAGAKVVFTYASSESLAKALEDEAAARGYTVYGFKADAGKFSDAEASVNFTIEKLGGLDILVNNAGITRDNLLMRMSEEDFDSVLNANMKSVFNYTKLAIRPMMSQRYGKIVNITSVVGLMGNAGQANYAASKAGMIGFTKSIAKEVASRNINVNAIAPGFITTDMTDKLNDKQKEALLNIIPLKRMGNSDDIANAVLYLSSPLSDYVTGQVLTVDGGMVM